MNAEYVLDASAVLAVALGERGHDAVQAMLPKAVISAVNYSEALAVLVRRGVTVEEAAWMMEALNLPVVPFDETQAVHAAAPLPVTSPAGLSFGDRACLATAEAMNCRAVTAEAAWDRLKLPVKVQRVR